MKTWKLKKSFTSILSIEFFKEYIYRIHKECILRILQVNFTKYQQHWMKHDLTRKFCIHSTFPLHLEDQFCTRSSLRINQDLNRIRFTFDATLGRECEIKDALFLVLIRHTSESTSSSTPDWHKPNELKRIPQCSILSAQWNQRFL